MALELGRDRGESDIGFFNQFETSSQDIKAAFAGNSDEQEYDEQEQRKYSRASSKYDDDDGVEQYNENTETFDDWEEPEEDADIHMSGVMLFRGKFKIWKANWFVLEFGRLAWYDVNDHDKLIGEIDLMGTDVVLKYREDKCGAGTPWVYNLVFGDLSYFTSIEASEKEGYFSNFFKKRNDNTLKKRHQKLFLCARREDDMYCWMAALQVHDHFLLHHYWLLLPRPAGS
jgi:hypothetical protein